MRRWLAALALVAAAAIALAGGLAAWAWHVLHTPYGPPGATELDVVPGSSAGRILSELAALGFVPDATLARLYLVYVLGDPPLRSGEYRIEGPATTAEILDLLVRGDVVLHPVTLVEGLTLEETAAHLAAAGFGGEARFLAAMRSPAAIADLDPEATTLEGYLFPDTYSFPRATPEDRIVRTLVANFRRRMDENLAARGPAPLRELVTLASIVEKEARLDAERPVIAGVYRNRLDRGIGLYADPTVIFALKQLGTWDGDIRRRDLELDSPYNTYRHPGLPPGPICSPGLASLLAAAAPADVPYLYFVSRNDGSHVFAETLREHNQNVERWQRRYWREKREEDSG
ncbi:MAG: endolytic transglycosylase MltG [Acidobacteriota bacterium]|nr:endolytic transglycosylase MltG [Acidobacteriota bacterium]MDH3522449.1 endolytic transglycosylase MltG [Acidobacteriota bacterium]